MRVNELRKYSGAGLLLDEHEERGFFEKLIHNFLKTRTVNLRVKIPTTVYERSLVFCKDIEDAGVEFKEADLINILYHDFLSAVKKSQKLKRWYDILSDGERMTRPLQIYKNNKEISPLYPTLFEKKTKKKSTYTILLVEMESSPILRGEWFLRDLEEVDPNHDFTVEKILEILYCDFIYRHQRGDTKNIVENIVSYMKDNEED